jgi:ubiquinone/menaquinone biosynthesis C-methylase UbiE
MQGIEHIPWAYDLFMGVVERFGLHRWRLQLASEAGGRTLDLGCGTGRNFRLFGPQTQVIGLELDFRLLARARARGPGLPLVVGRAEQLPFRADSFDTVVSSLVFCSVADPDKGLGEVARILVSDGQLRMLEHVRSRHEALGRLQDLIQPAWTWVAGGCHPNRDTEDTVEQAGFSIDPHEPPGRTTLRCFVARARRTASRAG